MVLLLPSKPQRGLLLPVSGGDATGNKTTSSSILRPRNLIPFLLLFPIVCLYGFRSHIRPLLPDEIGSLAFPGAQGAANATTLRPPVACIGPRGKRINESVEDQIRTHNLGPYPVTFSGSYEALGMEPEWSTAEERYGPYGYDTDPNFEAMGGNWRRSVNWSDVNWGGLQAQCFEENKHRFPSHVQQSIDAWQPRLRLHTPQDTTEDAKYSLGNPNTRFEGVPGESRTLLVLRAWDTFHWTEEDKINVRALISEAGLQSGGEFSVVLFVNVKDASLGIFNSTANYERALRDLAIPDEFRNLTMLWDDHLLESWYPRVREHRVIFQINQSLQLLARFYPEFEHFWQLELDSRSLGHYTTLLRLLGQFARDEPRKQSWERASYFHLARQQGSYYGDFFANVNASLNGGATIWGPLSVPEVPSPIGPPPPVDNPEDDDFAWGVGEDADVIVTHPCSWVNRRPFWFFHQWHQGLSHGDRTPQIVCQPAIQRASRRLLLAVHAAQMHQAIALPSEATLPTFALWHGLKLSFPPLPTVQRETELDARAIEVFFNGGSPGQKLRLADDEPDLWIPTWKDWSQYKDSPIDSNNNSLDEGSSDSTPAKRSAETTPWREPDWRAIYRGFGAGEAVTNPWPRLHLTEGMSWWWASSFPRRIMDVWSEGGFKDGRAMGEKVDEAIAIAEAWDRGDVAEGMRLEDQRWSDMTREAGQLLQEVGGRWYAPAGWLHPVKTRGQASQPR